ncbi:MAG: hypothetical protein KGL39_49020 [Patescibacteria group bacterium]|nr:hypothetical protein [Patescibacteria group bacterium]
MTTDPVTGPMPREEFKKLIDLPAGQAAATIRKYNPLFGREDGTPIKWRCQFTRTAQETGYATVEAATEEEAQKLASKISDADIEWKMDDNFSEVCELESVEPMGVR